MTPENSAANFTTENSVSQKTPDSRALTYRAGFYALGLLVLAMGLTLNTKAGLGVSPIISIAYSVSEILQMNFGDMTLILYTVFVGIQLLLHLYNKAERRILLADLLQLPLSLIFTRFLNLFSEKIPNFATDYPHQFPGSFPARLLILLLALLLTGIGAALSLNMRIIPNPGDGIVQTISDVVGKSVGLVKNLFDISCVLIATCIGLFFRGNLIGIGIGTLLAMLGVGRVIAVFNHFLAPSIADLTGLARNRQKKAA